MSAARRYRLDDLRRYASALATRVGVAPVRASTLATHLLWFDAAGAARLGMACLPECLQRIEAGSIDPAAEPTVGVERPGTAVLDGRRGVPLLVLERASGLAVEKARDTGIGLVRVVNTGPAACAASVASEAAVGPMAALVLGPGPSIALALPGEGGLPAVFDPALAPAPAPGGKATRNKMGTPAESLRDRIGPWVSALIPEGGWLVVAASVPAVESLSSFHERLAEVVKGLDESDGRLLPAPWEARRLDVQSHGIPVDPQSWKALTAWAERFGVAPPEPMNRPA